MNAWDKKAEEQSRRFIELYGDEPRLFRAPGRVNLIGEHTDYNNGFVLPLAINLETRVAAAPNPDFRIRIYSREMNANIEIDLDEGLEPEKNWGDYIRGVIHYFCQDGRPVGGANLLIESDIPPGSGLSSSAALTVSVAYALSSVCGFEIEPLKMATVCRLAESRFAGTNCGIMDQLTSIFGQKGHALLIDCLDSKITPIPLEENGASLVIVNTMVRHELAESEYNNRRRECDEAVKIIRAEHPDVRSLRDITVDNLARVLPDMPGLLAKRARHVVTENRRVIESTEHLRQNNFAELGKLMNESHESLRDDYEVSCDELDLLVELASNMDGVFGARMTGGGFGGCTVNLMHPESVDEFIKKISAEYESKTGQAPMAMAVFSADGAGEIEEPE